MNNIEMINENLKKILDLLTLATDNLLAPFHGINGESVETSEPKETYLKYMPNDTGVIHHKEFYDIMIKLDTQDILNMICGVIIVSETASIFLKDLEVGERLESVNLSWQWNYDKLKLLSKMELINIYMICRNYAIYKELEETDESPAEQPQCSESNDVIHGPKFLYSNKFPETLEVDKNKNLLNALMELKIDEILLLLTGIETYAKYLLPDIQAKYCKYQITLGMRQAYWRIGTITELSKYELVCLYLQCREIKYKIHK